VADFIQTWAKATGCSTMPVTVSHKDGLKTVEYRPDKGRAKLTVLYVEGHGHAWPGGKAQGLPPRVLGSVTGKLDATRRIWEFFRGLPPTS
jgi:poly(3-hydroxybutyrate) depolymerase